MVVNGSAVDRSGVDLSALGTTDRVAELRRRLAAMPGGGLPAAARSVPGALDSPPTPAPPVGPAYSAPPAQSTWAAHATASALSAPPSPAEPTVTAASPASAAAPAPAAPTSVPTAPTSPTAPDAAAPASPAAQPVPGVPVPGSVAGLLPGGVLPAGRVTAVAGSATLRVGLLAAATAAGVRCAVVGWPELGVAAVAEQGGRLDCLALIPDPGPDPAAVMSVLLDGLDLVLLGPAVASVAPSRARVLAGRVRAAGAVLLVGPGWPGADLMLAGRHCRYGGLGAGAGRLASVSTVVRCSGRSAPAPRTAEWVAAG